MSSVLRVDQLTGGTESVVVDEIINQTKLNSRIGSSGPMLFRNKIIDGKFEFWYEGLTQTTAGYGSDTMWYNDHVGSTKTVSQQVFDYGVDLPSVEIPLLNYFSRTEVTSVTGANNYVIKETRIEDVRTLSGKYATLSFYAKADIERPLFLSIQQNFGDSGSTSVYTFLPSKALSSSWAKYSCTIQVPSIAGKTIGANSYLSIMFGFDVGSGLAAVQFSSDAVQQSGIFDLAAVQFEEGIGYTEFENLHMSLMLLILNRYYETTYIHDITVGTSSYDGSIGLRAGSGTPNVFPNLKFNTEKRILPTISLYSPETGAVSTIRNLSTNADMIVSNSYNITYGGNSRLSLIGFILSASVSTYSDALAFHYVADARL